MDAPAATLHATALLIGRHGILITGPSGAGKSMLAFHLIETSRACGRFAAVIADDRVVAKCSGGRLVASSPPVIFGRAELHGLGILDVSAIAAGVIDLVVSLHPQAELARLPESEMISIDGVALPRLAAPMRDAVTAARLILRHPALHLRASQTQG